MAHGTDLLAQARAAKADAQYEIAARLLAERRGHALPAPRQTADGWAEEISYWRMSGQVDTAIEVGEAHAEAARALGLRAVLADVLRALGMAEDTQGGAQRVRALYEEAIRIADEEGLLEIKATALRALVLHWSRLGHFETARTWVAEAFAVAELLGDPKGLAWCHLNDARISRSLGQIDQALPALQRAAALFSSADDTYGSVQARLATVMITLSRRDQVAARAAVDALLRDVEHLSAPHLIGIVYNEAGEVARMEGKLDEARGHYERAVGVVNGLPIHQLVARMNLCLLDYLQTGAAPHLPMVLVDARQARRNDVGAIGRVLAMAVSALAGDAAAYDQHANVARLHLAQAKMVDPDLALLATAAARSWLDHGPTHAARAVRATALARQHHADEAALAPLVAELVALEAPVPLGPFLASAPLGRGGMGVVYKAQAPDDRIVAVKVLHDGLRATFEQEMAAVAALDHPGIVRVLDYGRCSPLAAQLSGGACARDAPWLAFEYLPGGTLHPWLGEVPWEVVKRVALHLLDALAHAHARGVLHLDLKPENILLVGAHPDHGVMLVDFGLATLEGHRRQRVGGTVGYMAPEQLTGQILGPEADLFALGATIWTLLCGAPPYSTDSIEGFLAEVQHDRRGTFAPRTPVPEDLPRWLAALLAPHPADRLRRAADAARALEDLGPPVAAAAPSPLEPLPLTSTPQSTLAHLTTFVAPPAEAPLRPTGMLGPPLTVAPPPVPPTWPPRPTRPADATALLLDHRPGPLVPRPVVQNALWDAVHRVSETGRSELVVLRGPQGSGRKTVARALVEDTSRLGLTDPRGGAPLRVMVLDALPHGDDLGALLAPAGRLVVAPGAGPAAPAGATVLPMPDLSAAALTTLLLGLAPLAPALAQRLANAAGGSPGLARALLGQLADNGDLVPGDGGLVLLEGARVGLPRSVEQAAQATLDRLLPARANRRAVTQLAVLAQRLGAVPRRLWAALAPRGADLEATEQALVQVDALEAHHGSLRFRRPDLLWTLRRTRRAPGLHRHTAAWLAEQGADPAAVGWHLAQAGDWEAALDALSRSAASDPALLHEAVIRLGLSRTDPRRQRVEARLD